MEQKCREENQRELDKTDHMIEWIEIHWKYDETIEPKLNWVEYICNVPQVSWNEVN